MCLSRGFFGNGLKKGVWSLCCESGYGIGRDLFVHGAFFEVGDKRMKFWKDR